MTDTTLTHTALTKAAEKAGVLFPSVNFQTSN